MILLSGNMDLAGIFFFFIFLMFGPPVILVIFGAISLNKKPNRAKILFILAAVYCLVGLGICFSF